MESFLYTMSIRRELTIGAITAGVATAAIFVISEIAGRALGNAGPVNGFGSNFKLVLLVISIGSLLVCSALAIGGGEWKIWIADGVISLKRPLLRDISVRCNDVLLIRNVRTAIMLDGAVTSQPDYAIITKDNKKIGLPFADVSTLEKFMKVLKTENRQVYLGDQANVGRGSQ